MKTTKTIEVNNMDELTQIFGVKDWIIRKICNTLKVDIVARDNRIKIYGKKKTVEKCIEVINNLLKTIREGEEITENLLDELLSIKTKCSARENGFDSMVESFTMFKKDDFAKKIQLVQPKSEGQRLYIESMEENPIVLCTGPAGTGKTFLAVACALKFLRNHKVRRIVLTRPAVEAGERLGFLPGDYQAKVNPYLRPVYDALNNLLEYGQLKRLLELEIVEVAPLAYMRGRSLDDSFIILDEGQNTTSEQMKMFLTRMGKGSRIVVTGDITQIDLPYSKTSGLVEAISLLKNIDGIKIVQLTKSDIVRDPLVQRIVDAYEKKEKKQRH